MLNKTIFAAAIAVTTIFAGTAISQPAEAAIKCAGPNQVTNHGLIRTPYCEDNYLARVAGFPPKAIRYNPSAKDEACRRVGHMPKVTGICDSYGQDGFFIRN